MSEYVLRLYLTGRTGSGDRALANLHKICVEQLEGRYELEIVDLRAHPQLAADEQIVATPMLEKELPLPVRRIIGDLSNTEKVLLGLDIVPAKGRRGQTSA